MTTLPNFGLPLPTRGQAGAGQWADKLDAWFRALDEHTHVDGQGLQVPTLGININADLTFSATWAPTALHRIQFASVADLSDNAQNLSLFVSEDDNEIYWRNFTGNHVQLTDGNSLNVGAFVGGIGGDYTAVQALLDYDDATLTYRLRQQLDNSVRQFARASVGSLDLFEHRVHGAATAPQHHVRLQSPVALAAPYEVTFPAAVPASTSLVQMSSAGVLTASNVLPATSELHHGDRVLEIPAAAAAMSNANFTIATGGQVTSTGATVMFVPIQLTIGDRVKSVSFERFGDGAVDLDPVALRIDNRLVAPGSNVLSTTTVTNVAAAWNSTVLNPTDTTLVAGDTLMLEISVSATGFILGAIFVTYDHP